MAFSIEVTETITRSYEFETEAEAQAALESGDFYTDPFDVVASEVVGIEVVKVS